jgi:DNA-directed RNA polymerase subunit beta
MVITARNAGSVKKVTAQEIQVGDDVYRLRKFVGLNERTCQNQKPLVFEGQKVLAGEVIADGAATHKGELALGRNIMVAFMTWDGYNFEDAILISEELA